MNSTFLVWINICLFVLGGLLLITAPSTIVFVCFLINAGCALFAIKMLELENDDNNTRPRP